MATNKNPAYKRSFTTKQNHSAYYFTKAIIKPDIVRTLGLTERNGRRAPKLPKMLEWQQWQLARVMARAVQMDRRVVEIEAYVKRRLDGAVAIGTDPLLPLTSAMTDAEFQRWTYCIESSRRAEETAAKLRTQLREELEHIRDESAAPTDIFSLMAQQDQVETIEPADEQAAPAPAEPQSES